MRSGLLKGLVLWVFLICVVQAKQSQGPASGPNTANQPIRDMHLMTASVGWALAGQQILWTDTAGQSWTDITPPLNGGQQIDTVYFLDARHGWAVLHAGEIGDGATIFTAATADGGKSWTVQAFALSDFLRSLYSCVNFLSFVDAQHGWMLVRSMSGSAYSKGELFATEDGGRTWNALPDPPIAGKIQFVSASTGWLVGGVHGDELYRTQDSGQNWVRKVIELPDQVHPYVVPDSSPTYVTHPFYDELSFQTPEKGLLVVTVHVTEAAMDLLTYSTDDGGSSWQVQNVESGLHGVYPLAVFDSTYIEASSFGGTVSLRHGSAKISAPLPADLPPKVQVRRVEFLDAQHGWLLFAGAETAIAGTDDGGKTVTLLLKKAGASSPPPVPHPASSSQTGAGIQPALGGVTGASGVGIDSCSNIPVIYINSLYGEYGGELTNGWANSYTVYGFYLGGVTSVAASCFIGTASFITLATPFICC